MRRRKTAGIGAMAEAEKNSRDQSDGRGKEKQPGSGRWMKWSETDMILEKLANAARERVKREKEQIPSEEMRAMAEARPGDQSFPFEAALRGEEIAFICEVKKASPSKGVIAENFPYLQIAKEYEEAGASCISVLTEPDYFLGSNQYLEEIKREVTLPLLRKDFTVDPYMIYQAKALGADAVLLICSLLETEVLREYLNIAHLLGLSAVVEAHDEQEVSSALKAGARIIGVNNRNLKDFTVDIHNSIRLRGGIPENRLFIAESGIRTAEDVRCLRENRVNAVLIGETLMRCPDKKKMLEELRGEL